MGPTEEETRTTPSEVPDSVGVSPDEIRVSHAGGVTIYVTPTVLPARMDSGAWVEVVVKHGTTNTPVNGQVVRFGVTDGYIAPAVDTTDAQGVASARFAQFSDSMPRNDTVKVYAWTVVGEDTLRVARTVSLKGVKIEIDLKEEALKGTIVPAGVSVTDAAGMPVPKGGMLDENTMEMFVGAVVQDINGNPVADGTKVHFSAVVSGMLVAPLVLDYWSGVDDADDEIKAVLAYGDLDVVFEDINNDTVLTPGVDLHLDLDRSVAARGDDVNGDGRFDYNQGAPDYHDFFWDFNGNGRCDLDVGEPVYVDQSGTAYPCLFADLNRNGIRDVSELVPNLNHPPRDSVKVKVPYSADPTDSMVLPQPRFPASGDFRHSLWEMRPFWEGEYFDFTVNEYAVAVNVEEETRDGVAYATITYPRQLARRLIVTVNGEANGVRDRDGERFVLPLIR